MGGDECQKRKEVIEETKNKSRKNSFCVTDGHLHLKNSESNRECKETGSRASKKRRNKLASIFQADESVRLRMGNSVLTTMKTTLKVKATIHCSTTIWWVK